MEVIVKIKLSSGKEIEVTLAEFEELKKEITDNAARWYPVYPYNPHIPSWPYAPGTPIYVSPDDSSMYVTFSDETISRRDFKNPETNGCDDNRIKHQ